LDIFWFLIPIVLVSLGNVVSKNIRIYEVKINLKDSELNEFIDEQDLRESIDQHLGYPLKGGKLIHNDLGKVENFLKNNKFVKEAEVLSDHSGRLVINITQERPIARIVNSKSSYYLTQSGAKMPTSHRYASRVTVLLGDKVDEILSLDTLNDLTYRAAFVEMMNYVYNDPFLKAQIESIEVLDDKKMILYPQVSHQRILFGTCEEYVEKFKKLNLFYSQILPRKGWNTYQKVNLDYKNQIICE
jgi:cell division protein FtsQ